MSDIITVRRWTNEAGKATRHWYWEIHFDGKQAGAGILPPPSTEQEAWQAAALALARAAYTAGLIAGEGTPEAAP